MGLAAAGATLVTADAQAETLRERLRAQGVEPPATLSRALARRDAGVGRRPHAAGRHRRRAGRLRRAHGRAPHGGRVPRGHAPQPVRRLHELPGGRFLYQRSQIHFSATHPLELRLFDAQRGTDTLVHPTKPSQPIRAGFVSRLWGTYTPQWCQPRNHPCDPERPSESLVGDLAVSPGADALAFLTTLEEDLIPPVQAIYVYRGLGPGQTLEFREISVSDFRAHFGSVSPARALEPETLAQIFAR